MARVGLSILFLALGLTSSSAWAAGEASGEHYRVDYNDVARNCEYYIDTFGAAYDDAGTTWLEGLVRPSRSMLSGQVGTILRVGAAVNYVTPQEWELPPETISAMAAGQDSYLILMPYLDRHYDYTNGGVCLRRMTKFNIFVDVRDNDGRVRRVWAVPDDEILNPESVFWGYPFTFQERGRGAGITYTYHPSPIMRLKDRCRGR